MKLNLPKIYPITDTRLSKISHAEQVERLIAGGATLIQLREKSVAPKDFYEQAKAALKIARRGGKAKIIVNDRVDIALALKADGVHLGQDDLPIEQARKILGSNAIIGFSTHTLEQAINAAALPIDYLAVGPVFPTRTKENPDPTIGIETVAKVREAVGDFPIVAIGGITLENFRAVLQAGANSVAVIGDLLSDSNKIIEKTRLFLNQ